VSNMWTGASKIWTGRERLRGSGRGYGIKVTEIKNWRAELTAGRP